MEKRAGAEKDKEADTQRRLNPCTDCGIHKEERLC